MITADLIMLLKATLTVFTALLQFTNPKAALKSTATPSPIKTAINKS